MTTRRLAPCILPRFAGLCLMLIASATVTERVAAQTPTSKSSVGDRRIQVVRLHVTTSSWRSQQPYDIESSVKRRLDPLPLRFDAGAEHDVTLLIDYRETAGHGWTRGQATDIYCSLKIVDKQGDVLSHETFRAPVESQSAGLFFSARGDDPSEQLYRFAIEDLEANPVFKYLHRMVPLSTGRVDRVGILIDVLQNDTHWKTRHQTVEMLGDAGDSRALAPLFGLLTLDSEALFMGNQTIRAIQNALRRLGWRATSVRDTVYFFIGTYHLSDSDAVAINSLGREAIEPLREIANDPMKRSLTRRNAERALRHVGGEK